MNNETFEAAINEHIQMLQDLNNQMVEISKKIGVLQEEGRALHGKALEVKGAIEALAKMKAREEEKAKKPELILPDKALVAADGQTIIASPAETPAETVAPEAPAAEVK